MWATDDFDPPTGIFLCNLISVDMLIIFIYLMVQLLGFLTVK